MEVNPKMTFYDEHTIPGKLAKFASQAPHEPAFGFFDSSLKLITLTKQELWDLTRKFAARLHQCGFQKGDVICNTLPNSRVRLVADMGIMSAGAIALNGSVFLTDAEDIMLSLRQSGSKCAIIPTHGPTYTIFRPFLPNDSILDMNKPIRIVCDKAPSLQYLLPIDISTHKAVDSFLQELMMDADVVPSYVTPADSAFIFTTSGSTSLSKLVLRSHREVLIIGSTFYGPFVKDDIVFNNLPLGWLGGFPFSPVTNGVAQVSQEMTIERTKYPAMDMWKAIMDIDVTCVVMVPQEVDMYTEAILSSTDKPKLLRLIITGGQPVKKVTHKCIGLLTHQLNILYGSTEVGIICNCPFPKENQRNISNFWVGDLVRDANFQMKIAPDETYAFPDNNKEVGHVLLKGPMICESYFDVTATIPKSPLNADGWFDTADVGYFDENKHLYIIGRSCDTIQCGTALVHPALLEEQLRLCPGVGNVIVVGIPHPVYFQDICACIIPSADSAINERMLKQFCKEKYLIDDEDVTTPIPKHYFFMKSFPLTSTGKLSRKLLTEVITKMSSRQNSDMA